MPISRPPRFPQQGPAVSAAVPVVSLPVVSLPVVSVLLPLMPERPEQLLRYARLVHDGLAQRLWQGQAVTVDPSHGFAYAAGAGLRVPVGLAVTLMPMRHPFQAAMEARSLAATTGHPVIYGMGPGPELFQRLLTGAPYPSQLGAVRDYLTTVRGLLDAVPDASTSRYAAALPLPALTHPPVLLGLGVLRPRMARLAGELADVAITWLAPAAYLAGTVTPALAAGAARAGRATPRISALVPVALHRPGRKPYRVALGSAYGHLRAPHYQDMLAKAGVTADPGDPRAAAKALIDSGCFLYEDPAGLRRRLREYAAAGVSEVVLNLTGVHAQDGADAAYEEVVEILAAVAGGAERAAG
jgi:5,10-methylenetetrahydromethanopterin reductase